MSRWNTNAIESIDKSFRRKRCLTCLTLISRCINSTRPNATCFRCELDSVGQNMRLSIVVKCGFQEIIDTILRVMNETSLASSGHWFHLPRDFTYQTRTDRNRNHRLRLSPMSNGSSVEGTIGCGSFYLFSVVFNWNRRIKMCIQL